MERRIAIKAVIKKSRLRTNTARWHFNKKAPEGAFFSIRESRLRPCAGNFGKSRLGAIIRAVQRGHFFFHCPRTNLVVQRHVVALLLGTFQRTADQSVALGDIGLGFERVDDRIKSAIAHAAQVEIAVSACRFGAHQ